MVKQLNKCFTMIQGKITKKKKPLSSQYFHDDLNISFRVVYFSIHRYENGEFWPNLKESNYHYVGENEGIGYNFNVPLNKTGMKNADYLAIFQQVLLPMAYEVIIYFF